MSPTAPNAPSDPRGAYKSATSLPRAAWVLPGSTVQECKRGEKDSSQSSVGKVIKGRAVTNPPGGGFRPGPHARAYLITPKRGHLRADGRTCAQPIKPPAH